jgi:hypothetical protein
MSPRAACRLATIGFTEVYDYVAGKAEWLARGLPRDGEKATEPRAIDSPATTRSPPGLTNASAICARACRRRPTALPWWRPIAGCCSEAFAEPPSTVTRT